MPRFRITNLLVLTAIGATVLLLSLKVPVHQSYSRHVVSAGPGGPIDEMKIVREHRAPSVGESLIRLAVWLPWALFAWYRVNYVRRAPESEQFDAL